MKKKNENDEKLLREALNKALKGVLDPTGCLDSDDYAYLLARRYFQMHGYELKGDDIYLDGKKNAVLSEASYDGKKFDLKIKVIKPIHFIMVNIEIKKEEVDGDKK